MRSLIQKIRDFRIVKLRDEDAYAEFYKEEYSRIKHFVASRIDRFEVAEELANEAFVEVWRYIFRERQSVEHLSALLLTIVRRLIIDYYRKRRGDEGVDPETIAETISDGGSIIKEFELDQDAQAVRQIVDGLRSEYREVVILRFVDEFDIREIASILNKTPGAVRVLLHRALATLRKEIGKRNDK